MVKIRCSASDRIRVPARPAQHVHRRVPDLRRRTRRSASTIGGGLHRPDHWTLLRRIKRERVPTSAVTAGRKHPGERIRFSPNFRQSLYLIEAIADGMVETRSRAIRGRTSDGRDPAQRLRSDPRCPARPAQHVHRRVPDLRRRTRRSASTIGGGLHRSDHWTC